MENQWFFSKNGNQIGPISDSEIIKLIDTGTILPTDLIWREGFASWVLAGSEKSIFPDKLDVDLGKVDCPNCGIYHDVDFVKHDGLRMECTNCGNAFNIHKTKKTNILLANAKITWQTGNSLKIDRLTLPDIGLAETRRLVETEVISVRNILTEKANTIPFHDIEDFGNCISIEEIFHIPVYKSKLQTLYEKRRATSREASYSNWKIPDFKISKENVDIWHYTMLSQTDFVETDNEFKIADSQVVSDCSDCGSSGKVECDTCNGNGRHTCGVCRGSCNVGCNACGGSGQTTQSRSGQREEKCHCKGGYGSDGKVCYSCNGRGWITIDTSHRDLVSCQKCGGGGTNSCNKCSATGIVTCESCLGSGILTCSRCDGNGEIVSYLVIEQNFSPDDNVQSIPGSQVESTILEKFSNEDFQILLDRLEDSFPSDIETVTGLKINMQWVKNGINTAIKKSNSNISNSCKIICQRLSISEGSIIYAQYTYNNIKYENWIIGNKNEVHALRSPFSDFFKSLLDNSINSWKSGSIIEGAQSFRKCNEIARKDPTSQVIMDSMIDLVPTALKAAAKIDSSTNSLMKLATNLSTDFTSVLSNKLNKWLK